MNDNLKRDRLVESKANGCQKTEHSYGSVSYTIRTTDHSSNVP